MGKNNSLTRDFDKDKKIFDYHCVRKKNFFIASISSLRER